MEVPGDELEGLEHALVPGRGALEVAQTHVRRLLRRKRAVNLGPGVLAIVGPEVPLVAHHHPNHLGAVARSTRPHTIQPLATGLEALVTPDVEDDHHSGCPLVLGAV